VLIKRDLIAVTSVGYSLHPADVTSAETAQSTV